MYRNYLALSIVYSQFQKFRLKGLLSYDILSNMNLILRFTALFAAAWFLYFSNLGKAPLFDPDEPIYGKFVQEMLQTSDFMTLRFNGKIWYDKPPLFHWLAAFAAKITTLNEASMRLPSAIFAVLVPLLVYFWAQPFIKAKAAFCSAIICGTALLHIILARSAVTDMTLTFFLTFSLLSLSRWELSESSAGRRRFWAFAAGTSAGFAMLVKGPVSIVLLPIALVLHKAITGKLKSLLSADILIMLFFSLLTGLPWFIESYRLHPDEFWHDMVLVNHVYRFLQPEHPGQTGYWFSYFLNIPNFFIFFFPWSMFFIQAAKSSFETISRQSSIFQWLIERWNKLIITRKEEKSEQSERHKQSALSEKSDAESGFTNNPTTESMNGKSGELLCGCESAENIEKECSLPVSNCSLQGESLAMSWITVVFLFFSISKTQLITYIFPLYPAAAFLVGKWIASESLPRINKTLNNIKNIDFDASLDRGLKSGLYVSFIITLALIIASIFKFPESIYVAPIAGVILTAIFASAVYFLKKSLISVEKLPVFIGVGMVVFSFWLVQVILPIAGIRGSTKEIVSCFEKSPQENLSAFYTYRLNRPSLFFYSKQVFSNTKDEEEIFRSLTATQSVKILCKDSHAEMFTAKECSKILSTGGVTLLHWNTKNLSNKSNSSGEQIKK
ncbi:MAG: glycosyltransferase family 39 protein [Candidatus Riflebacteria bacterium]|nr:glycosyltransferase family 39 protein [Candidatus Riflebacteria bacterium]